MPALDYQELHLARRIGALLKSTTPTPQQRPAPLVAVPNLRRPPTWIYACETKNSAPPDSASNTSQVVFHDSNAKIVQLECA